jgi:short-subunit dehydrogenase
VITGASAGVGRAVVGEFARRQARVALLARDAERLEGAKREVEDMGGQALALPTDVADARQVERAAERAEQEFGPIDIWINNAMVTVFAPFTEITPEEFHRVTEVTYLGFVYGTMSALRRMKPRNRGVILQVGSALAYRSIPLQSAYCGAKHAIVGFTDSVRCELIHDNSAVHITVVHLPAMNTPQFSWCRTKLPNHPQPVPPIFEPEVAARAIYWAAHQRRRELYVGFPTSMAIYGQELAPGIGDRYLGHTGYDSQQTSEPVPAGRPDNLFQPVAGNWAAHGVFTRRARNSSAMTWFEQHRQAAGTVLAGLGLFAFAALRAKRD